MAASARRVPVMPAALRVAFSPPADGAVSVRTTPLRPDLGVAYSSRSPTLGQSSLDILDDSNQKKISIRCILLPLRNSIVLPDSFASSKNFKHPIARRTSSVTVNPLRDDMPRNASAASVGM